MVVDSLAAGGGAERYVVDLARELRQRGSEVAVACSVAGPLGADLARAGIPVHGLSDHLAKRRFDLRYALALRDLVRAGGFELVHAHLYASIAAAAFATAGTSSPLVVTEHTEAPWRGRRARLASRLAYRRAARVTAVSEAIRDVIVDDFGEPSRKVAFVRNAVAAHDGSAPDALPPSCQDEDAMLIGRVGRLQPEKGMEVFLDAAARLAPDWPRAQFLVIGDGPLRDPLERQAERLGVADRVHFLGFRRDGRAIIANLDVLAISSHSDGSPLAIVEAMLAGVPVVASETGGIPDQVRDGVDGLLVEPGDADALAGALECLFRDEDRISSMGAAARRHAEVEFGYARMVDRIERIYSSAAAPAG
jgi:glycosyltransferase involved in cell wall biosynthesis